MKNEILQLVEIASSMKTALHSKNLSTIPSLIESWQTLVNRLEATLSDKADIFYIADKIRELKKEKRVLKKEVHKLEITSGDLKKELGIGKKEK